MSNSLLLSPCLSQQDNCLIRSPIASLPWGQRDRTRVDLQDWAHRPLPLSRFHLRRLTSFDVAEAGRFDAPFIRSFNVQEVAPTVACEIEEIISQHLRSQHKIARRRGLEPIRGTIQAAPNVIGLPISSRSHADERFQYFTGRENIKPDTLIDIKNDRTK
jgi:hypothetical protein